MAGLNAYLKSLPVFTKMFWRILVVLLALSLMVPLFAFQLHPWEGTGEQYVGLRTGLVWRGSENWKPPEIRQATRPVPP